VGLTQFPDGIGLGANKNGAGILLGAGTTASPETTSTAGANLVDFRTAASAASGSSYGLRVNHKLTGIGGSGAAVRAYGYAYAAGATPVVYGLEATAELHNTTSAAISGTLAGIRAVASIQQATGGTGSYYAGVFDFDCAAAGDATAAADAAFLAFNKLGTAANGPNQLFQINDSIVSNDPTKLVSSHADVAATHLIRCKVGSTPLWLLAANAHT
jgi:hypothetical protein